MPLKQRNQTNYINKKKKRKEKENQNPVRLEEKRRL